MHIMLYESYYAFTVDHPAVAVELGNYTHSLPLNSDADRGIWRQPRKCLFHPKAIENIKNSYLLLPLS